MVTLSKRQRSVEKGESAVEFMGWLNRIWDGIPPEQKRTAEMSVDVLKNDFVMVGLSWHEKE